MCVYDKHPLAGREIQYRAPNSWSRYTTPIDKSKSYVQHVKKSWNPNDTCNYGILSPLLYIIYVADLQLWLKYVKALLLL